ncbi:phosphatase PAP2 family protein [Adhaeribacter soli]|uniref:Phosphatase PAP2 family protein n=1 Tax=Adhaeribacter soli TaxID=2607655 RepID=A0A5N1IKS7_9BACT|nr:phosphatase PAP2 family protein [Adhaeribacter soli]KAA9327294.1 phosphatase PAP2 family protein [Adhaeribacter soli]
MRHEKKRELTFWTFFTLEALLLLGLFFLSFSFFFYLTWQVFLSRNQAFDQAAFELVAELRSDRFTEVMKVVTYFGSVRFFVSVPVALILFFLFFKKWRWYSLYIFLSTAGSAALNQYLKNSFGRERPVTAFYPQGGFSFPSGHAMIGAAFYGIVVYLIWKNTPDKLVRWLACGFLVCWQLLIGFSRVYLNVHYATDVLAGLSAGIFWCALVVVLVPQLEQFFYFRERRRRLKKLRALRRR